MSTRLEKLLSGLLVMAAVVMAIVMVRREFFPSRLSAGSQPQPVPRYVEGWETLTSAGKTIGPGLGPIKLIVFTDFECPFCRRFDANARAVLTKYRSHVTMVQVHFPLVNHRFARPAARAAECAGRLQGKFDEVSEALFAKQDSLGLKSWTAFALDAGVKDTVRFAGCMRETTRVAAIDSGVAAGKSFGLSGTPGVLLNGWYFAGAPPSPDELRRAIEDILAGKRPYPEMPLKSAGTR